MSDNLSTQWAIPMSNAQNELRVIVYQECGMWVAQGLELDIGVQARDLGELRRRFDLTFHTELEIVGDRDPVAVIGRAPQEFFDRWEQHSMLAEAEPDYQMALCA